MPVAAAAHVDPRTPEEEVATALAEEQVATRGAGELVVARTADQMIVALPPTRAIDVEGTLELVVAAAPEEDVPSETAGELVRSGRPHDRDRSAAARYELVRAAVARGSRRAALIGRVASAASAPGGTVRLQGVGRRRATILSEDADPWVHTGDVIRRPETATSDIGDIASI